MDDRMQEILDIGMKNITEQMLEMIEELEQANERIAELEDAIRCRESRINHLVGEIEGLKFGLRCNGVSGAEVSANE